jgi:hypothetical protein
MRLGFVFFPLNKVGTLFALGLRAGRPRSTCSYRFELGDDHDAWDRLLDYINDYSFFGGCCGPSR